MKKRITFETVKKIAFTAVEFTALVGFFQWLGVIPHISGTKKKTLPPRTYSDTVSAITKSNMVSDDKKMAIGYILRGEQTAYYDAVISIIQSNMLNQDKLAALASISVKES